MPNVGLPEILIVLVIALVVFGPKRLPELGRSVGKGFREFKGAVSGDEDHHDPIHELTESKAEPRPESAVEGKVVTGKHA
jgi:sec-independent protein translocase protein TatA